MKQIILFLMILLISTSCTNTAKDASELLPGVDIPADEINTSIKLVDSPELLNSHKNGEPLSLAIVNLSNTTIVFPKYYGVKLFVNKGGQWVEIQNNISNSENAFYLPTKNSYPLGLIVDTVPYILNLTSPTMVRIIIVGYKEDNNEQVGSFIDVLIAP